ncbi:MAG: DUF3570 domain-containing protein [Ectothiorhodospiraceae bacterium]|nr:hypothetical protein [Paracoccaceae bacterium]MCH8506134.1 DUF3570 domain-containing protein [Ectothiorhodospiraceae bacterium]
MSTAIAALIGTPALAPSHAANWFVAPEFEARLGFDDNIRLRERNTEDTWRGTASVGAVAEQYSESRQLRIRGVAGYSVYEGASDAPDDGDFQQLQGQSTFRTDRTTWRLNGDAFREKDVIERLERIDLTDPDEGIDPGSDIDVREREETLTRYRVFLSPSVDHQISARQSVGASYVGRYIGFDSDVPEGRESLNHEAEVRTDYAVSERTTVGTALYGAMFRPRGSDRALNTYGLSLTYGYTFTQRSGMSMSGGVRRSEPTGGADDIDSSTGFIGDLRMFTRGEDWRGALRLERRLLPSGRGVLRETDQVIVTGSREFGPRWEGGLRLRAFKTRNVGQGTSPGETRYYASAQPRISYLLSETWSVFGEYEFRTLRRVEGDGQARGNVVFLGIQYAPQRSHPAF